MRVVPCVRVLVVDVVLRRHHGLKVSTRKMVRNTHIDRHLVNVHAFFDTKLGDEDIESSIKNANDLGLTNDGTVASREIRYQHT